MDAMPIGADGKRFTLPICKGDTNRMDNSVFLVLCSIRFFYL